MTRPGASTTRNPRWTRDELILALDLYFKMRRGDISGRHPKVIELSETLNRLRSAEVNDALKYRNPNGVAMKLHNFSRFDKKINGTGLTHGGRADEAIWKEYSDRQGALSTEAQNIKARLR